MAKERFEISGSIRVNDQWQTYRKVVEASSESQAKERYYTLVGSKHRLKRNYIRIRGIQKVDGE